ncbi:type 1 glutamine amidotransferase domain-containing protein [Halobacillus sp. A1]|uniref:type 1 glutamine amidotransferase domain-containing protein n=1 Tax=Halobacillus sp. A1 TaxID=2880262 RepID=UPI0020A6B25E|nr:type 1 glutamine amidotransferase domain-containing protein [Halobacillus sp. A1]MCP3033010.1 type 1 glutamine amidotransferase domain-containing protein [Halobacillus sp. A1]
MPKILMVATNADQIADRKTGLWLSEFIEPATEFQHAGIEVTGASLKGGKIPIDPHSYSNELPRVWDGVMKPIHDTIKLSEVIPEEYDGIFFCGGHGAMVDFPNAKEISTLLAHFAHHSKPIGAVCHGAAAFIGAEDVNHNLIIKGKKVTGYSNEEEKAAGMMSAVPFSLEDELEKAGATYEAAAPQEEHVVEDGFFITGQNPQSTRAIAELYKNRLL